MDAESPQNTSRRPRLFVVDAPGFVFRAFHALPPLSTSRGTPTGAVLGFCNMLLRLMEDHRPEYLAAAFDAGKSFRRDIYADYKANRPTPPPELAAQFPLVRQVLTAFRIPVLEVAGYEADDLIATLTDRALETDVDVVIVSSDKDLMQLASERVKLLDTMKNKLYGPAEVRQKFGVGPGQLADWLALVGDASDNVPGVPGVGAKTATKLLDQWGSLAEVLASAHQITAKKLRENVTTHADQARMSRSLVELNRQCPLAQGVEQLKALEPDRTALWQLFGELEFGRLRQKISPGSMIDTSGYSIVLEEQQLEQTLQQIAAAKTLALTLHTGDGRPMQAAILGLSLCWRHGRACYIPVGHLQLGAPRQLALKLVLDRLRPLLTDAAVAKYAHDHKSAQLALLRHGITLNGVTCDTMLASYLLDPLRSNHRLQDLALDQLGHTATAVAKSPEDLSVEDAASAVAERAELTLRLGLHLQRVLDEVPDLARLLVDIELPLASILARMEHHGCLVEPTVLRELSHEIGRHLDQLQQDVQREAGWAININSPKQLQQLLFEQLGLSTGRKTKTGFSTDADVLADLALERPIAAKIDEYRALSKLKSTYLDALPALINRQTGRVHTSFNQAVAATGRLSSSDPNLQNIPIRTELGRRIREAFVAPERHVLLSADYSQIELRILAHLSQDPVLIDAFSRQQDIHARTAAEVFGVPPDEVTADQRRVAKAVNFGVIYGQTDWGLARQLRIPRGQARKYIEGYFARYAGVEAFMKQTIARARQERTVRTLLGRQRPVQDIDSRRWAARSAAERIVRNTPIQGTAADLIKIAMIAIDRELVAEGLDAPMVLTVHDELVFEVPIDLVDRVSTIIKEKMTSVMPLDVPLKVDVNRGKSWAEAH